MLYRFITSGYTDTLAYATAFAAALWIFAAQQYSAALPGCLASAPPLYGVAIASFSGALLICKYICLDGNQDNIRLLKAEKAQLETAVKSRDLTVIDLKQHATTLNAEIGSLHNKIAVMEENSPDKQLSDLRTKLRAYEDDKKDALSVLVKNLQTRMISMTDVHDSQLLYAADVLRQELELVENELKRGVLSYYELCLKLTDINDKLFELNEISLVSTFEQTSMKSENVADTWLHFIRANDNSDPAAVERSFKFFKVAFHPDRFTSESLKVEATRYFQHSINAHNFVKRMDRAAP